MYSREEFLGTKKKVIRMLLRTSSIVIYFLHCVPMRFCSTRVKRRKRFLGYSENLYERS